MPKQKKDHQIIVLEEMQDQFRAFGDGLEIVLDRTERIDNRIDKMDKRFDKMDHRFDKMDRRFDKMDQRFDKMDRRFDKMDRRFDKMDKRVNNIEISSNETSQTVLEIKHILNRKVDIEDFQVLEKRFIALEQFVHEKLGAK